MKNTSYFPMERNHYYYGKLLTVEDFELEQRYLNNKRRLLNRLLYGSGVVRGMDIVRVDETTLSLETGLAIDDAGREIIVDKPKTLKLSEIEGYNSNHGEHSHREEKIPYAYLCIAYEEEGEETVYNVAGGKDTQGAPEYNKWKEGYRLYLTLMEPGRNRLLSHSEIYLNKEIIYQENGIRIIQWLPRFLQADGKAELLIEVENMGQQLDFAFSYELRLQFLKYENRTTLKVDFDKRLESGKVRYLLHYELCVLDVEQATAAVKVAEDSFRMTISGQAVKGKAAGCSQALIARRKDYEAVQECAYKQDLEELTGYTGTDIYLAKILFVQAGNSFVIQEIEAMPFGQYVWSNHLGHALHDMLRKDHENLKKSVLGKGSYQGMNTYQGMRSYPEKAAEDGTMVRFGKEEIIFGKGVRRGSTFFSGKISHGLGIGEVFITLGREQSSGEQPGKKEIIYGEAGIFPGTCPRVHMAVKADPEAGIFIIGIKLLETGQKENCIIHWTAWKNPIVEQEGTNDREIRITPGIINMKVGEIRYLEAMCINMPDKRIRWSTEEGGGNVDRNGMYTAPARPGVYEVMAASAIYPNVETSVYIVVRE